MGIGSSVLGTYIHGPDPAADTSAANAALNRAIQVDAIAGLFAAHMKIFPDGQSQPVAPSEAMIVKIATDPGSYCVQTSDMGCQNLGEVSGVGAPT